MLKELFVPMNLGFKKGGGGKETPIALPAPVRPHKRRPMHIKPLQESYPPLKPHRQPNDRNNKSAGKK